MLALGVLWRLVRYALAFPLWGDEAFLARSFVELPPSERFGELPFGMVVPAGFMGLESAFTAVLGTSERALRALPLLCGIAGLGLYARVARRALDPLSAALAIGFLAASYYPARHGVELKPYSLDLLVSVALTGLAERELHREWRRRRWLRFGVASAIAVWFSYPAAFVAGGAWLVLVAVRGRASKAFAPASSANGPLATGASATDARESARFEQHPTPSAGYDGDTPASPWKWLAAAALLPLSFAAMYALHGSRQQWDAETIRAGQWAEHFPPLREPLRLARWLVEEHTGNMFAYPSGGAHYGSSATTLLVVIGLIALWRGRRLGLAALLVLPFALTLLAAVLGKYPYGGSARIHQHLAPAICLSAARGLSATFTRLLRPLAVERAARATLALFALFVLAMVGKDVREPYKHVSDEDCRAAVRWLARTSPASERWAVFGAFGRGAGPNLDDWGGSAARLRYYLVRERGEHVLWHPDPAALADGPVWVLRYVDNRSPFPDEEWIAFSSQFDARFGQPASREFVFGRGPESLTLLEYGH